MIVQDKSSISNLVLVYWRNSQFCFNSHKRNLSDGVIDPIA